MSSGNVEKRVALPVLNPETGAPSDRFQYAGKVDLVDGDKVIDWKSTSSPERFIREKSISAQATLYALALEEEGTPINEVEYRLVATPSIKLCKKDDFDPEKYEERCTEWLLDRPDRLVTHSLVLTPARKEQARSFLWRATRRLSENREKEAWLLNELACSKWDRACEFLPLCEALAEGADIDYLIDEFYDVKPEPHPELGTQGAAKEVVTYTSLTTLTLCEMRYYWRYERRLTERKEYHEPLWLGSAMHVGLEAYAKSGEAAAMTAIDEWAANNPAIGEGVRHKEQQIAKARAMVRACAVKWPLAA